MFGKIDAKNAFVLGTGGGNDIAAAFLVAQYLQSKGIFTDIGGMLSPGAIHSFNGNLEGVVNEVQGAVERWIPSKPKRQISFVDAQLPKYIQNAFGRNSPKVNMPRVFEFSTRFGTSALLEGVSDFIERNGYDIVVGVDVGGDVLARGSKDKTLLSPMLDFTSAFLLSQLRCPTYLIETGLLTDGELRPDGVTEILQQLRRLRIIKDETLVSDDDEEIALYKRLMDQMKGVRAGHAGQMMLKTLKSDKDIDSDYRIRYQIGRSKWETKFPVTIPSEHFGYVAVIDPKKLAEFRKNVIFPYENPLAQFSRLKRVSTWKTEMDLMHIYSGSEYTTTDSDGVNMLLLTPSTRLEQKQRRQIVKAGVKALHKGRCDMALMMSPDVEFINRDKFRWVMIQGYLLIATNPAYEEELAQTGERIQNYQKGKPFV